MKYFGNGVLLLAIDDPWQTLEAGLAAFEPGFCDHARATRGADPGSDQPMILLDCFGLSRDAQPTRASRVRRSSGTLLIGDLIIRIHKGFSERRPAIPPLC